MTNPVKISKLMQQSQFDRALSADVPREEWRSVLWNMAEAAENRKNSTTAREWEVALPAELPLEAQKRLVSGFSEELVGRYRVAVDWAIHASSRADTGNVHAHILTTTRQVDGEGFGAKTRVLDAKATGSQEITAMREVWADMCNQEFAYYGLDERIDHRSLADQREALEAELAGGEVADVLKHSVRIHDLDRLPQRHRGAIRTHAPEFAEDERQRINADAGRIADQQVKRNAAQEQAYVNERKREKYINTLMGSDDSRAWVRITLDIEGVDPEAFGWEFGQDSPDGRLRDYLGQQSFDALERLGLDYQYHLWDEEAARKREAEELEKERERAIHLQVVERVRAALSASDEAMIHTREQMDELNEHLCVAFGADDAKEQLGLFREIITEITSFWERVKDHVKTYTQRLFGEEGYKASEETLDVLAEDALEAPKAEYGEVLERGTRAINHSIQKLDHEIKINERNTLGLDDGYDVGL